MVDRLEPRPGFNWSAVSWGGPDEPRSDECSYCGDAIPEDSVPLIIWNIDGWAAQFCDTCQERWWGVQSFPDPVDPVLEPEVRQAGEPDDAIPDVQTLIDEADKYVEGLDDATIAEEAASVRALLDRAISNASERDSEDDPPDLGQCCGGCGRQASLNICMLNWRAPVPGKGWGCFVCDRPPDGAVAVFCDECTARMHAGQHVTRFACVGWPGERERVPIEELTEPFDHDPQVPH